LAKRIIAEALEVREITTGRLVDRLCKEGYLKRQENPIERVVARWSGQLAGN